MDWMKDYSIPRLSDMREATIAIGKAVTAWFNDIKYLEEEVFVQHTTEEKVKSYQVKPLKDPYGYQIENSRMLTVSRRIEMSTNLNVSSRHASTQYQTTNYGVGGMMMGHSDVYGYESGLKLIDSKKSLCRTGDVIATFMGWYEDTKLGGSTAFTDTHFEGILNPKKGSAAFWVNIFSCHRKDSRAIHAGCPVLTGSKWIVNKWMYSWDQWKTWPCYLKKHMPIEAIPGLNSSKM